MVHFRGYISTLKAINMKNIIFFLLLSLFSATGWGQELFQCGTTEPPNTLIISPAMEAQLATDPTIRTLPLAWHVVHNPALHPGDSAFIASKIPVYQNIMQKFCRKQNPDTANTVPAFRSVMADAKIEFCTKHIKYKRTTETSFTTNDKIKFEPTGSPAVDPVKHVNIWLGRLGGSLGGYAYFPTSSAVGQPFDGLVVLISTTHGDEQIAEIIVHELGHYLGLYHTFSGSCTGDGDFCGDTPQTDSPSSCTLSTIKCGNLIQVQNVMDYAHCATGWTYDQIARTNVTLVGIRNPLWNSGTCSGNPGNTPPVVSITFPTNNQQFPSPSSINITATASDPNGTVTKVEFFNGINLLSSDVTAPYLFVWQNVTTGGYTLTAKATDNGGATTISSPVNITVGTGGNIPPTCVITSPANGANVILPSSIQFTVNATDADGSVTKVEFLIGSTVVSAMTSPPYGITVGAPVGNYALRAKSYDNIGVVTTSTTVNVTVSNQANPLPVVSITSPVTGATFTPPASIKIDAIASDNTSISKVEFYQGNARLNTDNTAPYSFTWSNVALGTYVLTARAYDSQNASTVSSPVSVTVTNVVTSIDVVKTRIFPQTKQVEFEGNEGTKVRVPY